MAVTDSSVVIKDGDNNPRRVHTFLVPGEDVGEDDELEAYAIADPETGEGAVADRSGYVLPVGTGLTQPLTDTQLRATPVPVSGPATDAQLRATALPVSGPLTDAQLRATAVPVSGTVAATGPLTDTQLRATAVPVSAAALPLPAGAATSALQGGGLPAALAAGGGMKVEGVAGGVAQSVSGTVTANAGTNLNTSALATEAGGNLAAAAAALGAAADAVVAAGAAGSVSAKLRRLTQGVEDLKAGITALPSHPVTNAGSFPVQVDGAALTALQLIDDPVATLGTDTYAEATTKGVTVGAVRRDADTTLVNTTNEIGPLQMNSAGQLKVEVFSGESLPVNAGAGVTLATEGTVGNIESKVGPTGETAPASDTATSGLNGRLQRVAQRLTSLIALLPTSLGQKAMSASLAVTVASDQSAVPVSGTVTANAGTGTQAVSLAALPGVAGDVAHDGADSGNPAKVGFKAANALPTAVANNDRANGISDLWGRQLVSHIDPAQQITKAFNATTTQTGIDVWSPTSGKKIAITDLTITTYGTTAARVILWFGDNADTTYSAGTDQVLEIASFAPSATAKPGLVKSYSVPVFCTTADRELHITTDAGISIDVIVRGYEWV